MTELSSDARRIARRLLKSGGESRRDLVRHFAAAFDSTITDEAIEELRALGWLRETMPEPGKPGRPKVRLVYVGPPVDEPPAPLKGPLPVSSEALERIASALERIAVALENYKT